MRNLRMIVEVGPDQATVPVVAVKVHRMLRVRPGSRHLPQCTGRSAFGTIIRERLARDGMNMSISNCEKSQPGLSKSFGSCECTVSMGGLASFASCCITLVAVGIE